MSEPLTQALYLTAIGMGMTFIAIGTLAGGMFLMTLLIKDKKTSAKAASKETKNAVVEPVALEDPDRAIAAAAAVAIAIAQNTTRAQKARTASKSGPTSNWNNYVRASRFSQRQQYSQRRGQR